MALRTSWFLGHLWVFPHRATANFFRTIRTIFTGQFKPTFLPPANPRESYRLTHREFEFDQCAMDPKRRKISGRQCKRKSCETTFPGPRAEVASESAPKCTLRDPTEKEIYHIPLQLSATISRVSYRFSKETLPGEVIKRQSNSGLLQPHFPHCVIKERHDADVARIAANRLQS